MSSTTDMLACLLAHLSAPVRACRSMEQHADTMRREDAVAKVFEGVGLARETAQVALDDEQHDSGEAETQRAKKKQRRDSGSSSGGAADRSMSQFAEVMSKFFPQPLAEASSSPPITPEQWLADCMVSGEQRKKLVALLPDSSKPFTLLILSAFDDETLGECDLKPFQIAAWKKLAARHA